MEKVYQYINSHREEYVELLKKFCSQPSISAQNVGMNEMAALVRGTLDSLGAKTEQIETSGHPIVYGEMNQRENRTLTFYNHYDVQPVEPLSEWNTDPFTPTIIDGKLFARGSADNKGSMLSRICAVDAYQKVYGKLPLNVKFIIEGEEEVGSPHLEEFKDKYPEKLQTDGIIWEGGSRNINNGPLQISLGVKGMCYVELRCKGAVNDQHSLKAAIVINPAWRLVWALNTMKNEKEEILIEGFYDDIEKPTEIDMKYLENLIYDEKGILASMGLTGFINDLTGIPLKEKYLYEPTCNIAGIESGYTGQGAKTVLPSFAKVKMDLRLVQGQSSDKIMGLIRKHLDKHGFSDIEVVKLSGKDPFRTDPNSLIAKTVINNVERVYNMPPTIYRNVAGTTAMGTFCKDNNIPTVSFGVYHDGSQPHAPNENIFIDDYISGIKLCATVLHEFASAE